MALQRLSVTGWRFGGPFGFRFARTSAVPPRPASRQVSPPTTCLLWSPRWPARLHACAHADCLRVRRTEHIISTAPHLGQTLLAFLPAANDVVLEWEAGLKHRLDIDAASQLVRSIATALEAASHA